MINNFNPPFIFFIKVTSADAVYDKKVLSNR